MTDMPTFAWAVLPNWRARYPFRYSIVLTLALAIVLAPIAAFAIVVGFAALLSCRRALRAGPA